MAVLANYVVVHWEDAEEAMDAVGAAARFGQQGYVHAHEPSDWWPWDGYAVLLADQEATDDQVEAWWREWYTDMCGSDDKPWQR